MISKIKRKIKRKLGFRSSYEEILGDLEKRGLKIGKNFAFNDGCIIDPSHCWKISIGDNVTLAPNVHILAHDASTKFYLDYVKVGLVKIGNEVFIGAGTIILPNVEIGDNVIIGAGSVVNKDIPSNTVVAGNPAKSIGKTSEYITKQKKRMEESHLFDESYTLGGNITKEKKEEMRRILQNGMGFLK
ncbi:acetyltransferase [Bacillus thuringiensis]|uniref:acyltransferase n=1 Tax=Bacillus cereus group TaxID=86661 RepID=UPI0008FEABB7|nr:acyltransferase [Bacillus thuringiensis]MEC3194987.1 acyltransferase [Bacillus cereus]OJE20236.1 acetyltransferase [Bacillus thuringiensis]PGL17277.1 acetyltransferase [Bacillus thuringiensis]PGT62127.1 acetyltransferase [Bacillus thuringiensis]PGW57215.1 acetyltransferase [Bacillus thuringiensis]